MTEVAAQVSKQAVGNAVVIAELVRGAVLNDLQKLLGLVLGDAALSGRLGAIPFKDGGQSGIQPVLLLAANSPSDVISFTAGQAANLLEELDGVLLINQVAKVVGQKLINDFGGVMVLLPGKQLVTVGGARRADTSCDQRHIKDVGRLELLETVSGERAFKLENCCQVGAHILPHFLVVPVD